MEQDGDAVKKTPARSMLTGLLRGLAWPGSADTGVAQPDRGQEPRPPSPPATTAAIMQPGHSSHERAGVACWGRWALDQLTHEW